MVERKMLTGHTPELLRRKLEDFLARLAKRFGDMKGKIEFSMQPDVSLKDIGGLARAKQEIAGLVFSLKSPDLHKKWGTQPPNGVLLYGPPGTGKSLLAKALAQAARDASVVGAIEKAGMQMDYRDAEGTRRLLEDEHKAVRAAAKKLGMTK